MVQKWIKMSTEMSVLSRRPPIRLLLLVSIPLFSTGMKISLHTKTLGEPARNVSKTSQLVAWMVIGPLSKTAEDGNSNVGKTRRLIREDKKHTWIYEIKLTFVPSCSHMRLQLLRFHAVFKMWPTFQELTSIVSFRRRRWSQPNFSENRKIHSNQSKDMLSKIAKKLFSCLPTLVLASSFAQGPYCWKAYLHISWET